MKLCEIEFLSDTECVITERFAFFFKRRHKLYLSKEEVAGHLFATYRDVALWAFCTTGEVISSELRRTLNYYQKTGAKKIII